MFRKKIFAFAIVLLILVSLVPFCGHQIVRLKLKVLEGGRLITMNVNVDEERLKE